MWAKLKRFFANRWVLSAIGLIVLFLLIWFAGDAIAIYDMRPLGPVWARLGLIITILLVWAAWEGFKYWRAWRANKQMLAAISGSEADSAAMSQREVAELKQRFDQAMAVLRKARFDDKSGGGRNYLYQLPWYMFIGAPGSGKTTALVNSGLRFPLAETMGKEAVKGVGGTRNCDWWFTDEAVLLDTAGRYTTQSSNRDVDSNAWLGFLGLLKKFRPQLPLNGAVITLSVSDLFIQSAEERAEYARSVRARIQELYKTLGVRFPLYVMVTKCDLLAGFTEFYNDLGREARAQTWGMTFEYQPQATGQTAAGQFEREFDLLVDRLNQRLFTRMEEERDPQKRSIVFTFPQQFAGLKGLVKGFLDEVFLSSAFAEEAMLRGVYFTSGTQEGSPFDRVLGNISRNYGLERQVMPPAAASGRSYFLTRLLREVMFAESDLGGRSALIERRRARMLFAGYATLGVVALLLVAGWSVSFVRNKGLIADVNQSALALDKQVKALPTPLNGPVLVPLAALNGLRDMPTGYASRDADVPLSMGLGLYQGEKLGTPSRQAYLNLLRDAFLPRVAVRLEQLLREAPNEEARYEVLKTYVMLYDTKHLNVEDVVGLVSADWERSFPREVSETDRASLRGHLQTALEQKPLEMVLPYDKTLVEQVRRQLAAAPLAQRAYSRLKRVGPGPQVSDFKVAEKAGPAAPQVLKRRSGTPLTQNVPAMFTIDGYDKTFRAKSIPIVKQLADEEAWVLGPEFANQAADRTKTALADVQRVYLAEYIKTWDELLRDLQIVPAPDLAASIRSITILTAPDSPLKFLLAAIAKETRLNGAENRSAEAAASKTLDRVTNAVTNKFDQLLGERPAAAPTAQDRPEAQVDKYFELLHRAVLAPPGTATPLDGTLKVLGEYELFLRNAEDAIKRGSPAPSNSAELSRIKAEADRLPAPLNGLLASVVSSSAGQAASGAQAGVQKQVGTEVGAACKQVVEGRYPFTKGAQARDVPVADFTRLFAPNGVFDSFLKTKMQGLYDASGPVWRPVKLADNVESFPAETLAQFQNASVIREVFFPNGNVPTVTADLVLTKLDDGLTEVQITVDGQATRMTPGGGSAIRLNWPSTSPVAGIKLAGMVNGKLEAPPGLSFDSQWALFRLVDAARVEGGSSDRLVVSYSFGDKRATFELKASSVRNPLRLPELARLRCPA